MEFNLSENLHKFKELTESAIINISSENYAEVEKIMEARKNTIDEINNSDYSKQELRTIYKELGISECEDKLIEVINKNKSEILEAIKRLNQSKRVNNNYMNVYQKKSLIFNKEV